MGGLPRNSTGKVLSSGATAYYWRPPAKDVREGFTLGAEALGADFAQAAQRAHDLNRHLDDWRANRGAVKGLDYHAGFGTLEWVIERYKASAAWDRVSVRVRPSYEWAFRLVLAIPRKSGGDLGSAAANTIDAHAVDKIYAKLRVGPRGPRTRQAVICITKVARAWDVVSRLYPNVVPRENPWRGVELVHGKRETRPATRDEAFELHDALIAAGEPHLAAVPLICFEWHQRPENVLAGHLTWADYRPVETPDRVRVEHAKTGARVLMPLADADGPLFPELTAYLDDLERLGVPVVLMRPQRGGPTKRKPGRVAPPARPFTMRDARARVRDAARSARLADHITLAACRHGGMTELGDAELTEQQTMSLSGHVTPQAARLYVKKTERQRLRAARIRRAWVDQNETGIQNAAQGKIQNETANTG